MKTLLLIAAAVAAVSALPSGLKPEEQWRPARPVDMSKYQYRTPEIAAKFAHRRRVVPAPEIPPEVRSMAEECGLENPNGDRIVGGHEAQHNEWPWQVAIFIDEQFFCGGSVLSEDWIMTAGHCADGGLSFRVLAGAHNVYNSEPHKIEITSTNGFAHENYNSNNLRNDIALIRLPSPLPFSKYIRPTCLPTANAPSYAGETVTAVGWGKTSENGGISHDLMMVEGLPVITNQQCADTYGSLIYDGMLCIDSSGGHGVCNGDSGGTLNFNEHGNKYTQVGVSSFVSSAGCTSGIPHGFTRVSYFLDWIESHTGVTA